MKKADANLYDIVLARDISQRLIDRSNDPVTRQWMADENEYTRFPLRSEPATSPATTQGQLPSPRLEVEQLPGPMDFVTWGDLLGWCLDEIKGRAAFVLDSDGFVVANMGEEPINGFDGMGAELVYSMDHLDRVDGQAGSILSVEMEFKDRSVYGFRVTITEKVHLILGLICDESMQKKVKYRITETIFVNLSRLT